MKKVKIVKSFREIIDTLVVFYKDKLAYFSCHMSINSEKESFIFQSWNSLPIQEIDSYCFDKKYYACFYCSWKSVGGLKYELPKSFFSIKTNHKNIFDWDEIETSSDRRLKNLLCEKKYKNFETLIYKKGAENRDSINTNLEINICDVKSINLYDNCFEIIGEKFSIFCTLSTIGDYFMNRLLHFNSDRLSFIINEKNRKLLYRWSIEGYEPKNDTTENFLEEILGKENNKIKKGNINIGQGDLNIDI